MSDQLPPELEAWQRKHSERVADRSQVVESEFYDWLDKPHRRERLEALANAVAPEMREAVLELGELARQLEQVKGLAQLVLDRHNGHLPWCTGGDGSACESLCADLRAALRPQEAKRIAGTLLTMTRDGVGREPRLKLDAVQLLARAYLDLSGTTFQGHRIEGQFYSHREMMLILRSLGATDEAIQAALAQAPVPASGENCSTPGCTHVDCQAAAALLIDYEADAGD